MRNPAQRTTVRRPSVRLVDDGSDGYHGVLVYDGECPFCSAAATALRRIPSVGAIAHGDEAARRFLDAQFAEAPFALVFADVEEGRVYTGREAARELCERAGLPVLVSDVVGENYETVADAVRRVAGLDRGPDPYHDVLPMTDAARAAFDDLADAAWSTPTVATE